MKIDFSSSHPNAIDQNKIPRFRLSSGAGIPVIGIGTYHNEIFTFEEVAKAVYGAVKAGYRLVDCAAGYHDEPEIGAALEQSMAEGIPREDLFITSKLDNTKHEPQDVIPALKQTLSDLRLDYLDAYYIHWPFRQLPGLMAEGKTNCKPYLLDEYLETYQELEKAVDQGLIRYIGTSNLSKKKYEQLLPAVRIRAVLNQMELHPCFSQVPFTEYLKKENILPVAYSPIGAPVRPKQYRYPGDVSDIQQPIIVDIAKRHQVHPAVICVKWAVQSGQLPIPFTVNANEYYANLKAVTEDPLTAEEMNQISAVECGCRVQRGNDFIWAGMHDWHDVWDEDLYE